MTGEAVVFVYLAAGALIGEAMAPQPRLSVRIGWCLLWPICLLIGGLERLLGARSR